MIHHTQESARAEQPRAVDPNQIQRAEPNAVIRHLPADEYRFLRPLLEDHVAVLGAKVGHSGESASHVYFPESCIATFVSTDPRSIEVASIGNEGMTGVSAYLEGRPLPYQMQWQVGGACLRMGTREFRPLVRSFLGLERPVKACMHGLIVQLSQNVVCNALHSVEQRCARWLILTHHRIAPDTSIRLTHDSVAQLLGVRRAGVTVALGALCDRGLIEQQRTRVRILDPIGLQAAACECHGLIADHFEKVHADDHRLES